MRPYETKTINDVGHVSIHASVKDATGLEVQLTKAQAVSIHASVKDATSCCTPIRVISYVSIHASVKDATSGLFSMPS